MSAIVGLVLAIITFGIIIYVLSRKESVVVPPKDEADAIVRIADVQPVKPKPVEVNSPTVTIHAPNVLDFLGGPAPEVYPSLDPANVKPRDRNYQASTVLRPGPENTCSSVQPAGGVMTLAFDWSGGWVKFEGGTYPNPVGLGFTLWVSETPSGPAMPGGIDGDGHFISDSFGPLIFDCPPGRHYVNVRCDEPSNPYVYMTAAQAPAISGKPR